MPSRSIAKRPNGKWRARFRDDAGKEHARHFDRKVDAQKWLDEVTASMQAGTYVDPKFAKMTVAEWSEAWLQGYAANRPATVRQARTHLKLINLHFGARPLATIRPSEVKTWVAGLLADGRSPSYVYAVHGRLSQLYSDAVHDGVVSKSPCSRRTSPKAGGQMPHVATSAHVWAMHDAMPEHLRASVLLGAFVGLRPGEVCGLRVSDVDFLRGVIFPKQQAGGAPLKTEGSSAPVPIPRSLAEMLAVHVERFAFDGMMFRNEWCDALHPRVLERAWRQAKDVVRAADGDAGVIGSEVLPAELRFHDLRHHYASLLIRSGADVKVVQARLRHKSAKTTLDTYGHLWPDADERTRAAIDDAIAAQVPDVADYLRTGSEVTA